jgi:hypothetical protein
MLWDMPLQLPVTMTVYVLGMYVFWF